MRGVLFLFILILFYLSMPGNVKAQSTADALNSYYTALAGDYEMNGNVAAAQNGKIIYQHSFGFADAAAKKQNGVHSQFELASVSKLFTAVAVLQLKDHRLVNLDSSFQHYFPQFPFAGISIRHLLSHTSGLPDVEELIDSQLNKNKGKQFTIEDELQNVILYSQTHALPFKPGDQWRYSSAGYHLLGLLIEKISGETLAEYMHAHIFLPAAMKETYTQTTMAQKQQGQRVKNYQYNTHYETKLQLMDTLKDWKEWTYNLALETGGSGIISTTGDMLRFDEALYTNKLLQPQTLQEAFTPYTLNNGMPAQPFDMTYCGLGWFIFKDATQGTIVWGSGANPGTISLFVRNITSHKCFVVLHNVKCNPFNDITALGIMNGRAVNYRASLAFRYARALFAKGNEQAVQKLNELLPDTSHYELREAELDRTALEFRRAGLKAEALNTCELHVLHFPNSADAHKDYAGTLAEYGKTQQAIAEYKKVLALQPTDKTSEDALNKLLTSVKQ